jgi:hypothetical protein
MRPWVKNTISTIATIVIACLFGGGVVVWVLGYVTQPSVGLQALLTEPLPSPTSQDQNQILIVRNEGRKAAVEPIITVDWPRVYQPLDYKIRTSYKVSEETRTDSALRFKVEKLSPGDSITVVMAVAAGHCIKKEEVKIVHEEGVVSQKYIEFLDASTWRKTL